MSDLVIGIDGGNSKTDVVLATAAGDVLARVRGKGTRSYQDGMTVTIDNLSDLIRDVKSQAGLADEPVAAVAYFLANLDTPADEESARAVIDEHALTSRSIVHNDTFAILHAGAPDGWGVAVVCGAGINATGVHWDGRIARFLALGDMSGDWGGGEGVAMAGIGQAVRAGDGRGPATSLRERLAAHFDIPTVEDLAVALIENRISPHALHAAAPVVFAAAVDGDEVATSIVHRLADEIVVMVMALLRRLELVDDRVPIVLGGGTLQLGPAMLIDRINDGLAELAPKAYTQVLDVPPVAGAVLHAMAAVGADPAARERARGWFKDWSRD